MKEEDAKKLAVAIVCEMIGCDGDCDNCNQDGLERKRQEVINKINSKAVDVLKFAKSFKETTLTEQRELIFEKDKHFDVIEQVLAINKVIDLSRDIELGTLKNLLDAFNIYRKFIKNWNDNINHIVEDDLKVLKNIYFERINNIQERTDTNVNLSNISEEDLKAELARRVKK